MGVGRQSEHHRDAPVIVERRAEDASASARRRVVILDVVEQERLAGAWTLRQPHDGTELDVPIDLRVDLLQLVVRRECINPPAEIAERGRVSFNGHLFFPGLEHVWARQSLSLELWS